MKKGTIIAIIVAVALIAAGGIVLTMGLSFAKEGIETPALTERTVPLTERFDCLSIVTEDCDVSVHLVQTWEEARVEFLEYSQAKHTVQVLDGNLEIELTDHREWFEKIGVFKEDMQIQLYLPVVEYTDIHVITSTGDITMPYYLSTVTLTLHTSTGNIYSETEAATIWAESSTGEVLILGYKTESVWAKSDTGMVIVSGLEGADYCNIATKTGNIDMGNVKSKVVICQTDTGEVHLWELATKKDLRLTTNTGDVYTGNCDAGILEILTDTGDVEIEDSDAGAVNIETNTGDVEGHFLTSKWFQAHSDTGRVRVPDTYEGGECRIETDTGDIHFE